MLLRAFVRFQAWLASEKGQSTTEYAMIIAVIVLVIAGAAGTFSEELKNLFTRLTDAVKSWGVTKSGS